MTDTGEFQRPDWRDETQYQHAEKFGLKQALAWEFLRRNPAYQADWTEYAAECAAWEQMHLCDEYTGLSLSVRRYNAWCKRFEETWQLKYPKSPAEDFLVRMYPDFLADSLEVNPMKEATHFFEDRFDNINEYKRDHLFGQGAKVLIPVNLELPMTKILEQVKHMVDAMREEGIKNGTITPVKERLNVKRAHQYGEQLRVLDAQFAGVPESEMDLEIWGYKGAKGTANNRLKAAKKTMEGGYKIFLT